MNTLARVALASLLFLPACGGSTAATADEQEAGSAVDAGGAGGAADTGAGEVGGGDDAGTPAPRRLPCVDQSRLATDLPGDAYGALEGELVSIVAPGSRGCPNDSDHLHLQIDVGGKRYDVAVTTRDTMTNQPLGYLVRDAAPKPLTAGWATGPYDYVSNLGVHTGDFAAAPDLLTKLQTDLANVSTLTIHGRAYTDGTGMHDVHYNGPDRDGVLLLHGQGAGGADRVVATRYANASF